MAFQIKHPTVQAFVLHEFDPSGEAQISFRQGTARDNQLRDTLVFSQQERTLGVTGVRVSNSVPWTVRQEIEVRLTIVGCQGILRADSSPLFRFKNGKLDMTDDEFHEAWGILHPQHVCDVLHGLCLDVNPDWDYRTEDQRGDKQNPPAAAESEIE